MGESAREIMQRFVVRTGVGCTDRTPVRYLWTDAFAVCNLLGLHLEEADDDARRLALQLVDDTHHTLGRHRPDDVRVGWISGLDEEEGERHPTIGGLRIGKKLPERKSGEAFDPALEWDRDGQYFHYLTRWMHALGRVADVTRETRYRDWAVELAKTAHDRFCVRDATGRPIGLHWKMSIDLGRPLVPSMGQHDPLDGFLVYSRLEASADRHSPSGLGERIRSFAQICEGADWFTEDVLGLGGLLVDACALARMMVERAVYEPVLLATLFEVAHTGLDRVVRQRVLERSPASRLAFREFGLSIGLHAVDRLRRRTQGDPPESTTLGRLRSQLDRLGEYVPLAAHIEQTWLEPQQRRLPVWSDHLDINEVMLATSLAPFGYLGL